MTPSRLIATALSFQRQVELSSDSGVAIFERSHFALGALASVSVAFLEQPYELLRLAGGLVEIVVGELAPLNFGFTLELMPFPFELIGVHLTSPFSLSREQGSCRGLLHARRIIEEVP
jgi:hypothetical protein